MGEVMRRRLPKRSYARSFVMTMAVLALASVARGQDNSQNQQGADANGKAENQASQANQDQSNAPPSDTPADASAELNPAFRVSKLGSAQWLEPDVHSPLHLGPIYVGSISGFFLAADNLQFNQTNNTTTNGVAYVGIIRADVNYDKLTSFGRFSVQYLPEITIVNGGVETNFSNQSANFTISRALSPRWVVGVQDTFAYVNGHIIFGAANLDVNSVTGTGVQSPFLETAQRWLNNTASASFSYQWSSRDQISFTPSFWYQHSDLVTLPQDTKTIGGNISWTHALSATKSAGLYSQTGYTQFTSNSTQVVPAFPNTVYESFGGSFSDRLSQTLVLQASAGASEELGQKHPLWTATGQLTLRKDFQNSTVALDGVRETATGPFLTNGYTNRADVSYTRQLGRRWQASGGVAYQQQSFSGGRLSGTYVTVQTSYRFSRSLSWFARYARIWQNENRSILGINTPPGTSVASGITWTVAPDTGGLILPVRY